MQTDFDGTCQGIKRKLLVKPEAHSEPHQTSQTAPYAKSSERLKPGSQNLQKAPSCMLDWILNTPTHSKQTRDNKHLVSILNPDISANQAHVLNRFPETTFILPTTTSAAKGFTSVYEIQVTCEINVSQEGEGPHFDVKEWFKE